MPKHTDMPQNTIFKLIHITLIIILSTLIMLNLYFGELFHALFSTPNSECTSKASVLSGSKEDTLHHQKQLSTNIWLYVTEYNGPSAISPIVYRYYLEEKINGSSVVSELRKHCSFLEADHEDAKILFTPNTENHVNDIKIKITGKIYAFNNHCEFTHYPLNIFINTTPER